MIDRSHIIFKSNNDEWATPQDVYDALNSEFHFNLDPCCTAENAKCEYHFTAAENGLLQSWGGYSVFCNPPYSEIEKWVRKAYFESQNPNTIIVMLIPARTDTRYFHKWIYHRSEIRFIKGRLKFGTAKYNAPFPSMIVIYRSGGIY